MKKETMEDLSYIIEPLRQFAVPIETLVPDPKNARKHNQRNIESIKESLLKFGQRLPLIVQKETMVVEAGNGRLQAAVELGWTHLAALVVEDAHAAAVAFSIADNRTAELAEWDHGTLMELMRELPVLEVPGFEKDELEMLIANSNVDPFFGANDSADANEQPEEVKVVYKVSDGGDLVRFKQAVSKLIEEQFAGTIRCIS